MSSKDDVGGPETVRANVWPIFICYRQSDGRQVAERLFSLLHDVIVPVNGTQEAADDPPRLDVYFDQAAPGVSDWTALHEPYLKRARAFIVVCTPGAKIEEGSDDWVHREIDWWLENRNEAPILIDALGEDARYVPTSIAKKFSNAQRIPIIVDEWEQLDADERRGTEERTRARIVGGITQSAGSIYKQELAREKARSKELSDALAGQKRLSARLKWSFWAISGLLLLAVVAGYLARRQGTISEDRRITALSGKLAAVARSLADRSRFQLDTAVLLTAEGLQRRPNLELIETAQQLLNSVLEPMPLVPDTPTFGAVCRHTRWPSRRDRRAKRFEPRHRRSNDAGC